MKNRIKNLTPNKIIMLSAIITIIIFVAFVWFGLILNPNPTQRTIFIVMCLILGLLFAFALYGILLVFAGSPTTKERKKVNTFLSKDKFTQLSFFLDCGVSNAKILSAILNAEGCKFYAKLTEDDNILLIVKDKYDDEIYNTIISNYFYFTNHFKPKEELWLIHKYL